MVDDGQAGSISKEELDSILDAVAARQASFPHSCCQSKWFSFHSNQMFPNG